MRFECNIKFYIKYKFFLEIFKFVYTLYNYSCNLYYFINKCYLLRTPIFTSFDFWRFDLWMSHEIWV